MYKRQEYVPLGPYLGKSFCTSISAWVTPMVALDAARIDLPREQGMAFVVVTHDEALAARCGRQLRLVLGRLSEAGAAGVGA